MLTINTGNKHRDINGYILVKDYNHPDRNSHDDLLEHRLIVEQSINRRLQKHEVVHHINFIRNDNRVENLYLCTNRSEHTKCNTSLYKLVDSLLKAKIIEFKNGEYMLYNRRILVVDGGKS